MCEIYWNDTVVGHARVENEGMFYRFVCRCNLQDGNYRITVSDGTNDLDLGICVPEGSGFVCVTRVPKKRFISDCFSFLLMENTAALTIPVIAGEQFLYLEKLNAARLYLTNGQPEIVIM